MLCGQSFYKLNRDKLYSNHPEFDERISKNSGKVIISDIFNIFPEVFSENKRFKDDILIYGRKNGNRIEQWISGEYIEGNEALNKWKVVLPTANGTGTFGEKLSNPFVGMQASAHTQTYISFGYIDDFEESERLLMYVQTKFMRAVLGISKATQHNATARVWKNVPLQDFTSNSDINWSKSIPEIDQQLYAKYGLSEEEIQFIEEKVQPME